MKPSLRHSTILGIVLIIGAAAGAQQALGPAGYDLTWHTIDGGGGTSSGGVFELSGTIGQPDAGAALSGGTFTLVGGFWPGVGPTPNTCPPDISPLPGGDDLVNVGDLLAVISQWGPCPVPPSTCTADIAPPGGNDLVNVEDMLAIISNWGTCP